MQASHADRRTFIPLNVRLSVSSHSPIVNGMGKYHSCFSLWMAKDQLFFVKGADLSVEVFRHVTQYALKCIVDRPQLKKKSLLQTTWAFLPLCQ